MSKAIFWAFVLFVIWKLLRRSALKRAQCERHEAAPPPVERMVSCTCCKLYLPEKECMAVDGRFFCSTACRQQFDGAGKGR